MVGVQSLVFSLILASSALARPVAIPAYPWRAELCSWKLSPIVRRALCPRDSSSGSNTVDTPIGTAQGTSDDSSVMRFAVKYASAARWQAPEIVTAWELPNNSSDPTALPDACVQTDDDGNTVGVEDCLSMLLYVPSSISESSEAPTFMWIHGGSFVAGSATGAGLDGSSLATATDSIVAVIQYRLGALGFLDPSGSHNLAILDVMAALAFLQEVVPSFGGSSSKITIAGQSSGANMVRALLATPSASTLFQSAILQSDPMDYGFFTPTVHDSVLSTWVDNTNCSATDIACFQAMSLDDIMSAQNTVMDLAAWSELDNAAADGSEPIRPVRDGQLITNPLDLTAAFPAQTKPIILSTVLDEAAVAIYGAFTSDVDATTYEEAVLATFGNPRTDRILDTAVYAVSPAVDGVSPDQRPQLEVLGTDQIWRCATWTFARNWVGNGGKAYVGEYKVGATYPGNEEVPFCTTGGAVCHQDDIEIVFGTVQNPTTAQASLVTEMQARYKSFLYTGSPNAAGYATWDVAGTDNVNAINLGATGLADVGACNTSYWGSFVQYDYQVFDL